MTTYLLQTNIDHHHSWDLELNFYSVSREVCSNFPFDMKLLLFMAINLRWTWMQQLITARNYGIPRISVPLIHMKQFCTLMYESIHRLHRRFHPVDSSCCCFGSKTEAQAAYTTVNRSHDNWTKNTVAYMFPHLTLLPPTSSSLSNLPAGSVEGMSYSPTATLFSSWSSPPRWWREATFCFLQARQFSPHKKPCNARRPPVRWRRNGHGREVVH